MEGNWFISFEFCALILFLRLCEVQLLQQVLQIKLRHTLFLSSDLMPLSGQRNNSVPSNTVIRVTVGFWHK